MFAFKSLEHGSTGTRCRGRCRRRPSPNMSHPKEKIHDGDGV